MTTSQILQARGKNNCSFQFNFKTSHQSGLSLRGAAINDRGVPKLIFDAANYENTPSLTEEDVATVARVVSEGKRPEFYYNHFLNPSHPFSTLGRWYKHYCPQWLRGTSVGDLLSEADWEMKCLSVGSRSNDDKTEFSLWAETSKLDGLAFHPDFQREKSSGRILMSCKNVDVEESDNEISFVGEPKMQITAEFSPDYSKYITECFDSVAYNDKPLLLKMKELIKLILAIEWMKEQGVQFKEKWMKKHTEKKKRNTSKAIQLQHKQDMDELIEKFSEMKETHANGEYGQVSMKTEITKQTETGIEITVTRSCPALSLQEITSFRASYDDHDFLYEGMDCKMPFTINMDGEPLIPDVKSWSELYAETVPPPRVFGVCSDDPEVHVCNSGGVQTGNIPVNVRSGPRVKKENTASVNGTRDPHSRPQNISMPKRSTPTVRPPTTLSQNGQVNRGATHSTGAGCMSTGEATIDSRDGSRVDVKPFHVSAKKSLELDGQIVAEQRLGVRGPGSFNVTPSGASNVIHGPQLQPMAIDRPPRVPSPGSSIGDGPTSPTYHQPDSGTMETEDDGIRSPPDTGTGPTRFFNNY